MEGACSTHGGEEGCIQGFGGELRERDHWEDLVVDRKIISKLIKTLDGGVNWTDRAQDREV